MVNYGAAFKLPFSNWRRFWILFSLLLVVSVLSETTSLIGKLGENALVGVALKVFLVQAILYLAMIFFSLIVSGYQLRIARSASYGKNEFPSFENFFSLIVLGLKYFLASVIYVIPFVIALAIGFALMVGGIASRSAGLAIAGTVILVPVFLVFLFFFAYVLPMLMVHFAHEGRFSAFFELRKVLKYAFTTAYFLPWLAALGYSIALFIPYFIVLVPIALVSINLPVAALFIAPVTAIYSTILALTTSNIYGQAYCEVRASEKGKAAAGRLHAARKK